jgi:hypothetical protein
MTFINDYDFLFLKTIAMDYTLEIMKRQLEFQGYFLNDVWIYCG